MRFDVAVEGQDGDPLLALLFGIGCSGSKGENINININIVQQQ
ncbi:hypothetical protein ZOSMA_43G00300 [Zostera marina]|uniref:Uncharacterized protein n=1 Tax=Zostera marina TaxID=29655 RepID=A0A0K9P1J3_ZOSMR|nr:hypothetical protein ZOSMA_43G00300 [Zostera marina]